MVAKMPESAAWRAWTDFTDAAQVAPDTLRSPSELAERFNRETGGKITVDTVQSLMEAVLNA